MKPTLWHIPHGDRSSSFTSRRPGPIVGLSGVARSWWSACSEDYGGTSGRYPRGRLKCLDGRRGSAGFLSRGRAPCWRCQGADLDEGALGRRERDSLQYGYSWVIYRTK